MIEHQPVFFSENAALITQIISTFLQTITHDFAAYFVMYFELYQRACILPNCNDHITSWQRFFVGFLISIRLKSMVFFHSQSKINKPHPFYHDMVQRDTFSKFGLQEHEFFVRVQGIQDEK